MTQPRSGVLAGALDAHGGLERWRAVKTVAATLTLTGSLFDLMGHPRGLGRTRATVATAQPALVFEPFANAAEGRFEPDVVSIVGDGQVADRQDPRASFGGTPWDEFQLLYFCGYAVWNYLCTPFLFVWPGFAVTELEDWTEGSATWRRLEVTFPPGVPTHNATQRFYFDSDGLLRRLDYQPVVIGEMSAPVAHYCDGHRDFDGFMIPTRRRVFVRREDNTPEPDLEVVRLDIEDVRLSGS